jgi:hypothetical protein
LKSEKGGAGASVSERTVEELPAAVSEDAGIEKPIEPEWG